MKKIIMLTFVFCQLVTTQKSSLAFYRNLENQDRNHVQSVTAVTEVFGDSQKLNTRAVDYDKEVKNEKLFKSTFSNKRRAITNVYINILAAKSTIGINSKFAIKRLPQIFVYRKKL